MLQFAGRAKRLSRCLAAAAFMLPWLALGAQDGTAGLDPKPIRALVQAFTTADRQKIAASLAYPLRRPYPLPPIRSKAECLRRFDELFDEGLISEIRASSVEGGDWTRMGTKGILFKTGALWLDEGYRILAVNHETAASRARMQALIDAQKAGLPARLRDFERPELEFRTAGGLIRVDRKGEDYRLLVFRGPGRTRVRLELHGGNLRWDGTQGRITSIGRTRERPTAWRHPGSTRGCGPTIAMDP